MEATLNVEKAFAYAFEDNEWVSKLGLGAVIRMLPILNLAWSGYFVGIIRNVMSDVTEPLPTWDGLGKKFNDGLMLFGASFVYASPILIIVLLLLSMVIYSGLSAGNNIVQEMSRIAAGAEGVALFCLFCGLLLYGIILSIVYPAILVMFARERTFASCFQLREAFVMISKNPKVFFTAWGSSLLANLGIGLLVGFINFVVGWVPLLGWIIGFLLSLGSGVYTTIVYAHLFGQFGRIAFKVND